jgi:hypothetical protein
MVGPGIKLKRCAANAPMAVITAPMIALSSMYCLMLHVMFRAIDAGMIVNAPISSVPTSLIPKETMIANINSMSTSDLRRAFGGLRSGATVERIKFGDNRKVVPIKAAAAADIAIKA